MLKMSDRTHVLEQEWYEYTLRDVDEPNLQRHVFPYSEIPRIPFNHRTVPISVPEEIWITDTTFRDGQQAHPPYTADQIVTIYDMLHRLGGPNGIIRQCEFFLYTDKDKEAIRKCLERGYKYPEVTGWIRAAKEDFKLVKEMGLKETGILTSCSDYHIFLKLRKTRRQALEEYLDIVRAALEVGILPRCHLEDLTRADFYGFVIPFTQELMALADESKVPIKVRLCDTMGFAVPYDGASTPRGVQQIIYGIMNYGRVPSEQLEWHGHNDFHKVLVNAATAWLYGCCAANGTLFGLGERTGNPPIEGLVLEYAGLRGTTAGMDTTVITELYEYFIKELGAHIPPNYPFAGEYFNTTCAGIHADAILKDEEIYNIFDTEKILNRPLRVGVTDKSGAAGVAFWVNDLLGLEGGERVDKRDQRVMKIHEWANEQFDNGRTTSISPEEILALAETYFPEHLAEKAPVRRL